MNSSYLHTCLSRNMTLPLAQLKYSSECSLDSIVELATLIDTFVAANQASAPKFAKAFRTAFATVDRHSAIAVRSLVDEFMREAQKNAIDDDNNEQRFFASVSSAYRYS